MSCNWSTMSYYDVHGLELNPEKQHGQYDVVAEGVTGRVPPLPPPSSVHVDTLTFEGFLFVLKFHVS